RAILARQIKWMLAPTQASPEPGVTGGEMHKDSLGGAFDHVLKGGRIHKQLPVVLMRGEIERNFVGPFCLVGKRRRARQDGARKTDDCNLSRNRHFQPPQGSPILAN